MHKNIEGFTLYENACMSIFIEVYERCCITNYASSEVYKKKKLSIDF